MRLLQQEAVTLLESADGEAAAPDDAQEVEGVDPEAEAEAAARALLGLPGSSEGRGLLNADWLLHLATACTQDDHIYLPRTKSAFKLLHNQLPAQLDSK